MADAHKTKPPSPLAIADKLNELRSFVDCAWSAAGTLGDPEERDGIQTVLHHVTKEMQKLALDIYPCSDAKPRAETQGSEG